MEIVGDSLSKQKEICKKFSERYGIPEADIYAKAEEVYDEKLEEVCEYNFKKLQKVNPDLIYEDCKEEIRENSINEAQRRALVRARSFYKRQASKKQTIKRDGVPCFILMRFRDTDYENRAYQKVIDFINREGKTKAKELGYIDDEGNCLHCKLTTNFENQYGKKINKNLRKGTAIGFFESTDDDGNETREPRFIRIGFAQNQIVPVGKPAIVTVTEGRNPNPGPMFKDKNALYYRDGIPENDDEVLCLNLAQYIRKLYDRFLDKKRFVNTYDELLKISQQQIDNNEKNSYVGIIATCTSIGQRDDPEADIPCEFEIYDEETGDIDSITVFVPVVHFKGMSIAEEQEGMLFLTDMYNPKDSDEIRYHLGGFLPYESEEIPQ